MKMKHFLTMVSLTVCVSVSHADEFVTANYGKTKAKDFQDLVTKDFTARFPADSWELFVDTEAFVMSRSGQAICNAVVGVVPRGIHQFPRRQFKMTKTATVKPDRWSDAEALGFETECVRSAIATLMTTDVASVYLAHTK